MEKFFQALAALLPTGFAWPREAGSTLMRVIRGLAASFNEHHDFTTEAVRQWQPATTVNRLAEWEDATGLPDACFPTPLELLSPGRYAVDAGRIASTTRGTTATYRDDAGTLQTAAANVVRFEGGLLVVEDSATNLHRFSEQFDNAAWAKAGSTVVPNVLIGGLVVDKLVENTAVNVEHFAEQVLPSVAGTYTTVWRVVAGERTRGSVLVVHVGEASGATSEVAFDLVLKTIVPNANRIAAASIRALADGSTELKVTYSITAATTSFRQRLRMNSNAGAVVYTGDGASGMHLVGVQTEAGAVDTSYIPGTAAPGVRAADQIYLFPTEAATRTLRRQLLLSRLRGPVLAYSNSSPACTGAIVAICAGLGYIASVAYNTPFRCGVNRVGDRLGALDGKLYVTVTLQSKAFRVGASRVGQRLLDGQLNGGELACYLQRVIPARFQLNMVFI